MNQDLSSENNILFEKERIAVKKSLKKLLKRSERQRQKCLEDLIHCEQWEAIQHEAELLQSHYGLLKRGLTQVTLWDWKAENERSIALNPKITPQDEIATRFKNCKKLRKGIPHIETRLSQQNETIKQVEAWLTSLERLHDLNELMLWREKIPLALPQQQQKKKEAVKQEERQPYLEYTSAAGLKIWVGRKASDNEKLTFTLSRGSDWWLHAAGLPGSHVIIRTNKGNDPDYETIQDAIQLAIHYSKAKERGEGEVCVTQRKNVSRFGKGHVGRVQISKHKTYYARIDPTRFQNLKNRNEKNDHRGTEITERI